MKDLRTRAITTTCLVTLLLVFFFILPRFYLSLALFSVLIEVLTFEWPALVNYRSVEFRFLTPLYPALPFFLLILLNQSIEYRPLLLFMWFLVALFDTGSYFAGHLWGKHKIAPAISPGKSWEGFFGGYITTLLAFVGIQAYFLKSQTLLFSITFTASVSILALCGDLFESWFKRRAKVKDSGTLLPGHGGFLDRFDSILFVVFLFYLLRKELIQLIS